VIAKGEGDGGINTSEMHYMHVLKQNNETYEKLL
jgi:hypothetical protein